MKCTPTSVPKKLWLDIPTGYKWIAVDRHGKRFLNGEVGSRDTETERKLWDAVKNGSITDVMSDYWSPYEKFAPPELHTQSKAETYTSEGYNSLFRHNWLGYAESRSATEKVRICLNIPLCF
jgi:insertion element IS1 protein InsB